ncbi:MAG: YnbE family lipoprotein [Kangiellaceae bacterium]|nr:YnbE family lipoprotein [Kangiellaceae bacterium]
MEKSKWKAISLIIFSPLILAACNPTVRIEAPKEPIRIIGEFTIKHEIRIVVEKEVEEIFEDEEGLF